MFFSSKPWSSWNTHKLWKRKTRKTKLKIFKILQIHLYFFSWNRQHQGRIQEFVQGGAYIFFSFQWGAQHPLGPENPLKSIDFTGPPEYASGSLPLLIKSTLHILEMEAQRQPSIADALEDYNNKKISYKPWNGSSFCWRIWDYSKEYIQQNANELSRAASPGR